MNHPENFLNRLRNEKSPYLLQHASNPVDWYPWGEEAFTAAKTLDKPIFLSIGYATCHWCHTMEKESFENEEIAALLNQTFINIKVDREELPEIDALYMDFAQSLMAGSPGWPLNLILTPDLSPFFAATYLPPVQKGGLLGLKELTMRIHELWQSEEKEQILMQAEKIVEVYTKNSSLKPAFDIISNEVIQKSADLLFKIADPVFGGIRGAPKFPAAYQYNFLLALSKVYRDPRSLFLVEKTLDMIHKGGIYDHLGGGFSRYSIDEKWHIPHFEKMLYDNALLVDVYVEAYMLTHHSLYKEIGCEVLDYVLREMRDKFGGFYSAEDADSEGEEGKFYVWSLEEILHLLGKEEGMRFANFYNVTEKGNFHGKNVLFQDKSLEEFSNSVQIDVEILKKEFKKNRQILFQTREKRVHPFKDDKIITSWNGLMIYTLLFAGVAFKESKYIEAAKKGAQFILKELYTKEELFRCYREGRAPCQAVLDDYAFLIRALLLFFECGFSEEYLQIAINLTNHVLQNFKSESGAFYQSDGSDNSIILRKINLTDGAEPSGNAVFCENLIKLYKITYNETYKVAVESILKAVSPFLEEAPIGYFYHLKNLMHYKNLEAETFFIALNSSSDYKEELQELFFNHYHPHRSIVFIPFKSDFLIDFCENLSLYKVVEGKTTLYRCKSTKCLPPLTNYTEMVASISN